MKRIFLIIIMALLGFTACKKYKAAPLPDMEPIVYPDTSAKMMFINASPNAPSFDIIGNDVKLDDYKLSYPNNTVYKKMKLDSNNIKFNIAGTTFTYFSEIKYLSKNVKYSFFIIDSIGKKSHLFLIDDLTAPIASKAKIRFIHLSPNTSALDITIASTGNTLFGNRPFKSATGFSNLTPGNYNFELKLTGTSIVKFVMPTINLEDGKIYTVFIKGFTNPSDEVEAFGVQVINNN